MRIGFRMSIVLVLAAVWLLSSCGDMFETHPYDVNFKGKKDINEQNIKEIEKRFSDKETLHIAFISDTHGWYSDMRDEIAHINKRQDIDFVVHCGDLTDTGTSKEYEWTLDILNDLRYPYVALIGNHDFLGTGNQAYGVLFGDMNLSVTRWWQQNVTLSHCCTQPTLSGNGEAEQQNVTLSHCCTQPKLSGNGEAEQENVTLSHCCTKPNMSGYGEMETKKE